MPQFDKWELFRSLCTAKEAFGLSDRDLTVLNALLSFYPGKALESDGPLIVFPSNAALSDRAHGMAESTMRRHLAALVRSGVVARHDSPNGKRYAARGRDGQVARAFGFSLRPLLVRAEEIVDACESTLDRRDALRRQREEAVLVLRDASKLIEYGLENGPQGPWEALTVRLADARTSIRRKLDEATLSQLYEVLRKLLSDTRSALCLKSPTSSKNMSGKDAHNERHYQNSNKDSYESEPALEKQEGDASCDMKGDADDRMEPNLPLHIILKACTEVSDYCPDGIRSWGQLVEAAHRVRPMMGVSPDAWVDACRVMGQGTATIVLLCILQRMSQINSPGGYLRALTVKARDGAFSPGPMVMALLKTSNTAAA